MPRDLQTDLHHLKSLAFRRHTHYAPLLKKFHALLPSLSQAQQSTINSQPSTDLLWNIYDWLLVPLSLWPIDFVGLAHHLLEVIEHGAPLSPSKGERARERGPLLSLSIPGTKYGRTPDLSRRSQAKADSAFLRLLHLIDTPPTEETQSIVAEFEHHVESGRYEKMLKQAEKFDEQEKALLQNEQLAAEWAELKRQFEVKNFQNSRGVIRRRMSQERNLREGTWQFDWTDPRRRFHLFFDAFCYRWKLYGMEHDRPLLLKVSINPTPHGTMIVIPRHWSLDPRRDLDWTLINRLHRSRGAKKQGPKLSPARTQKLDEAKQVQASWEKGKRKGLRGEALHNFICSAMRRDPRTDASWWKRLLGNRNSKIKIQK